MIKVLKDFDMPFFCKACYLFLFLLVAVFGVQKIYFSGDESVFELDHFVSGSSPVIFGDMVFPESDYHLICSVEFQPASLRNYQDVFQTDDVNLGFRLEINESGDAHLLFPTTKGLQAIQVAKGLTRESKVKLFFNLDSDKIFSVYANGRRLYSAKRDDLVPTFKKVVVGKGFSEERYFDGVIDNFNLRMIYKSNPFYDNVFIMVYTLLTLLLLMFILRSVLISSWSERFRSLAISSNVNTVLFVGLGTLTLLSINAIYGVLISSLGYSDFAVNNFLYSPLDRFADLVKIAVSYREPLSDFIDYSKISNWPQIYQDYFFNNPYEALRNPKLGELSNLAGLPFGKLFTIANGFIAFTISPTFLYVLHMFLYLLMWGYTLFLLFKRYNDKSFLLLGFLLVISYPALFIFTRGHFFSALTVFLLFMGILSALNKRWLLSVLIFALVLNMRPNMFPFLLLPLVLLSSTWLRIKYLIFVGLATTILYACFYSMATYVYPAYDFSGSVMATSQMIKTLVYDGIAIPFGSSLYGAIISSFKLFDINVAYSNYVIYFLELVLFPVVLVGAFKRVFSLFELTFLVSSLYMLFTPVFGDYQLILFLIPLLMFFIAKHEIVHEDRANIFVVLSIVIFLFVPKNYYYVEHINANIQIFLNPIAVLLAVGFILYSRKEQYKKSGNIV